MHMKYILLLFFLVLEAYANVSVTEIKVLPRQDVSPDGNIGKYEIYTSADGKNWGTAKATGSMVNDKTEKTIPFKESARYFKLRILTEANGRNNSAIAEFNMIGVDGKHLDRLKWVVSADSNTPSTNTPWGPPKYTLDGDTKTFWITNWETSDPPPHEFVIDTGELSSIIPTPIAKVSPMFGVGWNTNPEPDISKYIVSWGKTPKSKEKSVDVTSTSYQFLNMTPGRYYISIVAVNKAGGISESSDELITDVVLKDLITAPVTPRLEKNKRYINVQMSTDGGKSYNSIGMVPYPTIKGQKYKTTIFLEK